MYYNLFNPTLTEGSLGYLHCQQRWSECSVCLCVYRTKFPVLTRGVCVVFLFCLWLTSFYHSILQPKVLYWLTYSYFSPRYRITIGNKTCVFEKENDPSVLRSPSAGKLIQYIVEDGGHVFAGQCYAEIEARVVTGLLGHGRESRKSVCWDGIGLKSNRKEIEGRKWRALALIAFIGLWVQF